MQERKHRQDNTRIPPIAWGYVTITGDLKDVCSEHLQIVEKWISEIKELFQIWRTARISQGKLEVNLDGEMHRFSFIQRRQT